MMDDVSATSSAEHGRLAKVLAGDPVVCGVLALARSLAADEWDAFARCVERMKAGMPSAEVLATLWRERGEEHPGSKVAILPCRSRWMITPPWDD